MAKLIKGNRIIEVKDEQVSGYLSRGYDEIDSEGKVIQHATGGRKVSLAEFNKVVTELEELKAKGGSEQINDLKEEIKVLEEENLRLDKMVKQLKGNHKN